MRILFTVAFTIAFFGISPLTPIALVHTASKRSDECQILPTATARIADTRTAISLIFSNMPVLSPCSAHNNHSIPLGSLVFGRRTYHMRIPTSVTPRRGTYTYGDSTTRNCDLTKKSFIPASLRMSST